MIIADAIAEFQRLHGGVSPQEIIVTPTAAVILTMQEKLPQMWDGIPTRIGELPPLVAAGTGTRVVLAAPDLPGGRIGVVAAEAA